jgi:hypothetical protein
MEFTLEDVDEVERATIPDGTWVEAEVVSITPKVKTSQQTGEKYDRLLFKFTIDDPGQPWDGQTIYGETSQAYKRHPDCKLFMWSQEILAADLPEKFRLNTDMLLSERCQVRVFSREYEKNGQPMVYNGVDDVRRNRQTAHAVSDAF